MLDDLRGDVERAIRALGADDQFAALDALEAALERMDGYEAWDWQPDDLVDLSLPGGSTVEA